jgi:hypothetical protein
MAYIRKRGNKWSYTVSCGIDPLTKIEKTKIKKIIEMVLED